MLSVPGSERILRGAPGEVPRDFDFWREFDKRQVTGQHKTIEQRAVGAHLARPAPAPWAGPARGAEQGAVHVVAWLLGQIWLLGQVEQKA